MAGRDWGEPWCFLGKRYQNDQQVLSHELEKGIRKLNVCVLSTSYPKLGEMHERLIKLCLKEFLRQIPAETLALTCRGIPYIWVHRLVSDLAKRISKDQVFLDVKIIRHIKIGALACIVAIAGSCMDQK